MHTYTHTHTYICVYIIHNAYTYIYIYMSISLLVYKQVYMVERLARGVEPGVLLRAGPESLSSEPGGQSGKGVQGCRV